MAPRFPVLVSVDDVAPAAQKFEIASFEILSVLPDPNESVVAVRLPKPPVRVVKRHHLLTGFPALNTAPAHRDDQIPAFSARLLTLSGPFRCVVPLMLHFFRSLYTIPMQSESAGPLVIKRPKITSVQSIGVAQCTNTGSGVTKGEQFI